MPKHDLYLVEDPDVAGDQNLLGILPTRGQAENFLARKGYFTYLNGFFLTSTRPIKRARIVLHLTTLPLTEVRALVRRLGLRATPTGYGHEHRIYFPEQKKPAGSYTEDRLDMVFTASHMAHMRQTYSKETS